MYIGEKKNLKYECNIKLKESNVQLCDYVNVTEMQFAFISAQIESEIWCTETSRAIPLDQSA